jgi:hypothetical protein
MTAVSSRAGDHGNTLDLPQAAERALDETGNARFFELQQDAERASANREAAVSRKVDTSHSSAAAKSERLRAEESARDMGQELPDDMAAALRRREEAAERARDVASVNAKVAGEAAKGTKALLGDVASTIGAAAIALNKATPSTLIREDGGKFVDGIREKLTWVKPDPAKFVVNRPFLSLKKGDEQTVVDKERAKQREWRSEVEETKKAWQGIPADVKEALAPLRPLREQPDVEIREFAGKFTARLPLVRVDAESLSGRTVPNAPDYRPSWVKEHWAEIEAEVTRQITAAYGSRQPKVMDAAQKGKALEKLAEKILASERLECAAIWQARAAGIHIAFRPDTSPAAVLGIEIPALAKRRH